MLEHVNSNTHLPNIYLTLLSKYSVNNLATIGTSISLPICMFIFVNCFFSREHTASVAGRASWTVTVHGGVVGSGSGVGVVRFESAWRASRVEMMVEHVDSSRDRYDVDEVAICAGGVRMRGQDERQ